MKKIIALLAALLLAIAVGIIIHGNTSASADPGHGPTPGYDPHFPCEGVWETVNLPGFTSYVEHPEVSHEETIVVVDEEAWTEVIPAVPGQHYSWTGGNLSADDPPSEVPPSDNWQPNTTHEPHDNGNGNPATWVNDSLHYTANSPQHASWFYYTAGQEEQIIEHPAVTHEETIVVIDEEAWTEEVWNPPSSHVEYLTQDPCYDDLHEPEIGTPAQETADPNIEEPGPGETITYQSFDGEGNLVEQRVSEPIPAAANQEGM